MITSPFINKITLFCVLFLFAVASPLSICQSIDWNKHMNNFNSILNNSQSLLNSSYDMMNNIQQVQAQLKAYNKGTDDIISFVSQTLNSINVFPNSTLKTWIVNQINNYNSKCNQIFKQHNRKTLYGAEAANQKIFELSRNILTMEELSYVYSMSIKKAEMDQLLSKTNFNTKQLSTITSSYNKFLDCPFCRDSKGNYLGFIFDEEIINRILPASATAFIISNSGYFVTNYHVVEFFETAKVAFKDQNLLARVIATDPTHDLAILKLDSDIKYSQIPFFLKKTPPDLGEEVFVLGYPLKSTMGKEIKLTNGIVSSTSGFQDDPSSFQISAPVQPGNSGSPVFNKNGEVIGVISAKHKGTENVSYAVKTQYLIELINSSKIKIGSKGTNYLRGKTLVDQIKILQGFVFQIETE